MKKRKQINTTTIKNDGNCKQLWANVDFVPLDDSSYDSFVGKSFTQEAYEAGLPVQIGDDVIQKDKPK